MDEFKPIFSKRFPTDITHACTCIVLNDLYKLIKQFP